MSHPSRRALALCALLACPAASARDWAREPRLADVRYAAARDLTDEASLGRAALDLPWPVVVEGRLMRRLRVGPGFVELEPGSSPVASEDRGSVRLRVLPATSRVTASSRVIADASDDGVAVRFVALATPRGAATAEALLTRDGRLTVQLLHVPSSLEASGVATPETAPGTAWTTWLSGDAASAPPRTSSASDKALAEAPASCDAETGTWCDRAQGDGATAIWIDERFDDAASRSRGWTATGAWRESLAADCGGGAAGPGGAWHHGDAAACAYAPRSAGDLVSPLVGPLTSRAELRFASRLATEIGRDGVPVDRAEILVDGSVVAALPAPADPSAWMTYSLPLGAWPGRSVRVGFRFTSDGRTEDAGWFVDDVILVDPTLGKPSCRLNAGRAGATPCEARESPSWRFDEDEYCAGCAYVFYVLVECGREMHLPLSDMEGADVRVTNMLDPLSPPALHCVNETARADRGLGEHPGIAVLDAAGAGLDCCGADGVAESWWGPALDVVDAAGPGRVAWGLDAGCPVQSAYDAGAGVGCADLPPTCGGLLDRLSPGEEQVVDCFIRDDSGLCGLYRVEVISGGNVWSLFANCSGDASPQFPIFFDCTEAWAAFDPLPELALANLVVTGACPAATASVDVVNAGCADQPGDVTLSFELAGPAPCGAPASWNVVVPGPLPAGASIRVTQPLLGACPDARVIVRVDPAGDVRECSESGSASACAAAPGADAVEAAACGCGSPAPLPEVLGDRLTREGARLVLTWESGSATTWRVARGAIGSWYSHQADAASGAGACDTQGLARFEDPDDGRDGGDWYYVVTAVDACGIEGSAGAAFDGVTSLLRPAGVRTGCE